MDAYKAVALAEGFEEGSEQEILEAWAYLIKTKLVWSLQGFFGRTAAAFIESGLISPDGEIL